MKKICFICNFDKTPVFMAIANILKEYGTEVFWISANDGYYKELLKEYPAENLLYISRLDSKNNNKPVGSFKINEIVYGDRILKDQPDLGYRFLTNIQKPVYEFIKNNDIQIVFGEVTHSYELLICRMCNQLKELNCMYISTMVTRIPDKTLFFFTDEKNAKVLELSEPIESKMGEDDFVVKAPSYLQGNDAILAEETSLKGLWNSLVNFVTGRNIEENDTSVYKDRWTHLRIRLRTLWNQYTYGFVKKQSVDVLKNKKFVLYGFHVQPEASVDISGRYNEDQYQNVINIWRTLPDDWYLVIKEHSNGIGNRSFSFLNKLSKLRNVILLDEKASAVQLMKQAQAVFTVTGTMALEAGLQGIPSITLAPMWFNFLNHCKHLTWEELEVLDLEKYCSEVRKRPVNKDEYMEYVAKHSFKGELDGIMYNDRVLEKENLKRLCDAFLHILERP